MIPAVGDHDDRSAADHQRADRSRAARAGETRSVTFAKQRLRRPAYRRRPARPEDAALGAPSGSCRRCWSPTRRRSSRRSATRLGEWLPAVPVIGVYPDADVHGRRPVADAVDRADCVGDRRRPHARRSRRRGSGTTVPAPGCRRRDPPRAGRCSATIAWPSGDLDAAVSALRAGDVPACGLAVLDAYGHRRPAGPRRVVQLVGDGARPDRAVGLATPERTRAAIRASRRSPTAAPARPPRRCAPSRPAPRDRPWRRRRSALTIVVATSAAVNGSSPNARCGFHAA